MTRSIKRLKGIATQILLVMTVLTAVKGVNNFCGHTEKYYNLPMRKVVKRAQDMGIPCEYWVREDGVKMFGPWVICAAHPSKIRYSRIDTSLGEGYSHRRRQGTHRHSHSVVRRKKMFDKFGEFDHFEEINKAAEGLKTEGDIESLKELAKENGIDIEDVQDYIDGITDALTNRSMAALGKLEIEIADLNPKDIMEDWADYIRTLICSGDEAFQIAFRKKGKSLKGCIGALLKWSHENMHKIDNDIKKAAGFSGHVELGIPGSARAKRIIKEYYLGR